MIDGIPTSLVWVAAIAIAYPLIQRLLLVSVKPKRDRMMELAAELLKDNAITQAQKDHIRITVENALNWRMTTAMAFLMPLLVVPALFGRPDDDLKEITQLLDDHRFDELTNCELASHVAANPICAILIAAEMAVYLFVGVLFGAGFGLGRELFTRASIQFASWGARGNGINQHT